jgi:anthranilate phosphoribosyltransferase
MMQTILEKIMKGESLTQDEAYQIMKFIRLQLFSLL